MLDLIDLDSTPFALIHERSSIVALNEHGKTTETSQLARRFDAIKRLPPESDHAEETGRRSKTPTFPGLSQRKPSAPTIVHMNRRPSFEGARMTFSPPASGALHSAIPVLRSSKRSATTGPPVRPTADESKPALDRADTQIPRLARSTSEMTSQIAVRGQIITISSARAPRLVELVVRADLNCADSLSLPRIIGLATVDVDIDMSTLSTDWRGLAEHIDNDDRLQGSIEKLLLTLSRRQPDISRFPLLVPSELEAEKHTNGSPPAVPPVTEDDKDIALSREPRTPVSGPAKSPKETETPPATRMPLDLTPTSLVDNFDAQGAVSTPVSHAAPRVSKIPTPRRRGTAPAQSLAAAIDVAHIEDIASTPPFRASDYSIDLEDLSALDIGSPIASIEQTVLAPPLAPLLEPTTPTEDVAARYTAFTKVDLEPARDGATHKIGYYHVLTLTQAHDVIDDVLVIHIVGTRDLEIVFVKLDDQLCDVELSSRTPVDDGLWQLAVRAPCRRFEPGDAVMVLTTSFASIGSAVIVPIVRLAHDPCQSEQIQLRRLRYPLYLKIDADDNPGWRHTDMSENDTESWLFARTEDDLPLRLHLATLQPFGTTSTPHEAHIAEVDELRLMTVSLGEDLRLQCILVCTLSATSRTFTTDPLLRLQFPADATVHSIRLDRRPHRQIFEGPTGECVVMCDFELGERVEIEVRYEVDTLETEAGLAAPLPVFVDVGVAQIELDGALQPHFADGQHTLYGLSAGEVAQLHLRVPYADTKSETVTTVTTRPYIRALTVALFALLLLVGLQIFELATDRSTIELHDAQTDIAERFDRLLDLQVVVLDEMQRVRGLLAAKVSTPVVATDDVEPAQEPAADASIGEDSVPEPVEPSLVDRLHEQIKALRQPRDWLAIDEREREAFRNAFSA